MRSLALASAMIAIGCAGPSVLARRPHATRPSRLDDAHAALLDAMVSETPTDAALAARERMDELDGLGSADVDRLITSSLAWLDALHRAGRLARMGDRCSETSRKQDDLLDELTRDPPIEAPPQDVVDEPGDVIGDIAGAPARDPIAEAPWIERLGVDFVWNVPMPSGECQHTYAVLRAIALTRAWLAASVDEPDVTDPFRRAVEGIVGAPSASCTPSESDAILAAVVRHLGELDPFTPSPLVLPEGACVAVSALSGPLSLAEAESGPRIGFSTPAFLPEGDVALPSDAFGAGGAWSVEVMLAGWHGGDIHTYWVRRLGGEWRVVAHHYEGQVCLAR